MNHRIALSLTVLLLSFSLAAPAQLSIPPLNKQIKNLLETTLGTTVDRGECWDLAAYLLNKSEAQWDGHLIYGQEINPKKTPVFPGDIIQFENVVSKYTVGDITYTEELPHHTAVVYEVIGVGNYKIAHQNNGYSGRKVGISDFNLANVKKGKIMIYRPVPKK